MYVHKWRNELRSDELPRPYCSSCDWRMHSTQQMLGTQGATGKRAFNVVSSSHQFGVSAPFTVIKELLCWPYAEVQIPRRR